MQVRSGRGRRPLSISENQDATTHDQPANGGRLGAVLGSIEAEQDESGKRVPAATKWGMAGLLLVYSGLGAYALISTVGSSAGPGHPEGVTRSVAIALGKPSASTQAGGAQASGVEDLPGQLHVKPASGASSGMATAPARPAAPPNEVLTAISAVAVGPDGASDGDHPELAPLVLDSRTQMSWVTHWYESAYFGNLKDGTGLLLDMGRIVTVRQIQLALGGSPGLWGADLQIRVGDSPNLASLTPVASASDVGGWVSAKLHAPVSGRYLQVWFTKLPLDAQGTYQEHVYGITVHGSAHRPSQSSAGHVNTTSKTTGRSWTTRAGGHAGGGWGGHGGHGGHDGGDGGSHAFGGGHGGGRGHR